MDTKLTLKLESTVIDEAKKYAKKNKTSLSRMIENYLKSVTGKSDTSEQITPLVKSLSGIINLESPEYKKDYKDYLSEKYK